VTSRTDTSGGLGDPERNTGSHLGPGAGPVGREGLLPLGEAQVSDHQPVVGGEAGGQQVPTQSAVQVPDVTLLGDHTWNRAAASGHAPTTS